MRSMTGYGRRTKTIGGAEITCEITTLNSKYLDLHVYLDEVLKSLRIEIGETVREYIRRGKVEVRMDVSFYSEPPFVLNRELLHAYHKELDSIRRELGIDDKVELQVLLNLPDIFKPKDIEDKDAVLGLVEDTLKDVVQMREREGEILKESLKEKIIFIKGEIEGIINETSKALKQKKEEIYQKLRSLNDLGLSISKEDIEFLGFRGDVDEEVIRLKSHLSLLEELIEQDGPVGKKINFVLQEVMREVNTIGSKAILPGTVHRIIGIKEKVDEIKEQGMNIE